MLIFELLVVVVLIVANGILSPCRNWPSCRRGRPVCVPWSSRVWRDQRARLRWRRIRDASLHRADRHHARRHHCRRILRRDAGCALGEWLIDLGVPEWFAEPGGIRLCRSPPSPISPSSSANWCRSSLRCVTPKQLPARWRRRWRLLANARVAVRLAARPVEPGCPQAVRRRRSRRSKVTDETRSARSSQKPRMRRRPRARRARRWSPA